MNLLLSDKPYRLIKLLLTTFILLMLALSCGGGGGDSSTNDNGGATGDTNLIGPEGGTFIDASSGVTVSVPAGALASETQLTCTYYDSDNDIPDDIHSGFFGDLGVVNLGPDGLEFDSPATITVPVSVDLTPGEQFPLFFWNTDTRSWQQTESLCTVNADGRSYSAQVSHFSMFTGDQLNGIDGIFGNLDPQRWLDVDVAFNGWIGSFGISIMHDTRKQMRDCCMQVIGRKFTIDYQGAVNYNPPPEVTGDITNADYEDKYEVIRTYESGVYLHLSVTLYWRCDFPDSLTLDSSKSSISLDDEMNRSTIIRALGVCYMSRMPGIPVEFSLNGPGSISPTSTVTDSQGYAYTTYTASDETGTARVHAEMVSCGEWDNARIYQGFTNIEVYRCTDWVLYIEMTFSHNTEDLALEDEIMMYIPIEISEAGVVSSPGGEGSHWEPSLTVSQENCAVTSANAPDFEVTASGHKTGPNIYVTVAPLDFVLAYTLTCNMDDDPQEVPLPPYTYLIQSIIPAQAFNEFPIELREGAFANGSGQSTMWSEEYPVSYTYYINVSCNL